MGVTVGAAATGTGRWVRSAETADVAWGWLTAFPQRPCHPGTQHELRFLLPVRLTCTEPQEAEAAQGGTRRGASEARDSVQLQVTGPPGTFPW